MRLKIVIGMLATATFIGFALGNYWAGLGCLVSTVTFFFYYEARKQKAERVRMEEEVASLNDVLKATNVKLGDGTQGVVMLDPSKLNPEKPVANFTKLPATKYDLIS